MRNLVVCGVAILVIATRTCPAQIRNAGTGSTVEGDVRRGEGVFLQGLGWYELSEAKAFDQYAKTVSLEFRTSTGDRGGF